MKLQPTHSQAEIFRKIFVYHNIEENEIALQFWIDDLFTYNSEIITAAWNEWRANETRKPKSYDIAKIAKRLKYVEESKKIGLYIEQAKQSTYTRGRSEIEDAMLDAQEFAYRNNPNLIRDIRAAKGPYEKITICALSQGINLNKINSLLAPLFKRWKENEQKEAIESRNVQNTSQHDEQNQMRANLSGVKDVFKVSQCDLSSLLSG